MNGFRPPSVGICTYASVLLFPPLFLLWMLIVIYSTHSVPSVHSAEEAQKGTANEQTANHLHCRDFFLVLLFFLTFSFTDVVPST